MSITIKGMSEFRVTTVGEPVVVLETANRVLGRYKTHREVLDATAGLSDKGDGVDVKVVLRVDSYAQAETVMDHLSADLKSALATDTQARVLDRATELEPA